MLCPLSVGSGVPIQHNMAWDEVYLHTKWHLDPSSRFAKIDMGRKVGVLCPFLGAAGSPSNKMSPEPRSTSLPNAILIHAAVWPQQIWVENWGAMPLWGTGSPSDTMSPEARSTSLPSGILIHPAVWTQQIWAENWGVVPLCGSGGWVPIKHNVARADAYLRAKWHLDPSSRLATIHGPKSGGCCAPFVGESWVPKRSPKNG